MTNFDDGEDFAVGDDDPRNTTYTIDVALFNDIVIARLETVPTGGVVFDPRIFGDRISASLAPTRRGVVNLDKQEVHRRFQLVLDQIEDHPLRARVARQVLELAQFLTDEVNEHTG